MGMLNVAAKVVAAGLAAAGAYCTAIGQWEASSKLFAGSALLMFARDFMAARA